MHTFLNWIVKSSADPQKTSMTIQGVMLTWISGIILIAQYFHVILTADFLTILIQDVCAVLGAVLVVVGLVRKIYFLFNEKKSVA